RRTMLAPRTIDTILPYAPSAGSREEYYTALAWFRLDRGCDPAVSSEARRTRGPMVSRRVARSYQARYSLGANKASMYDLTDAIDVHAHARGHDEEEPLHAAQEGSRVGMKAILFKSISPGRPWEVARQVQEDVDRWAEREGLRPVKCLSAWVVGIPLKPVDFTEIKAAVEGGILGMWMPPVTSAWSLPRLGGRGVW